MTQSAVRQTTQGRPGRGQSRTQMAIASISALAMLGAGVSLSATVANAAKKPSPKAVVVHKAKRNPFGKILVTASGKTSLYFAPGNTCTGPCLVIWPPLLMPAGKSVPKGSKGLGTEPFGNGQLQVTYHNMGLYTFYLDGGTSLTGNGIDGFVPANV